MIRKALVLMVMGFILSSALPASGQAPVLRSAYHDYRVVTVTQGLERPWSIAFLPGGDMLVTELPGRLRIIREGRLLEEPVAGVPEVLAQGQGGLLDVVPHPDFALNRLIYLSYSKPLSDSEGATTAVVRGRFENDRLTEVEQIFEANSMGTGTLRFSSGLRRERLPVYHCRRPPDTASGRPGGSPGARPLQPPRHGHPHLR